MMPTFPSSALRVGSRTGARRVGGGFPATLFRLRAGVTVPPWPRFQFPPRQSEHADFPHSAFLPASPLGLCDLSGWERFRHQTGATNTVLVKQSQFIVQPAPTPPLPAEASQFAGTHQMSAHLLFHPVFDKAEASTGVTNGKVVHPAAQNRVDELYDPVYRPRNEASEDVFELAQQRGALLELGRIVWPPLPLQTAHTAEVKTQESEAFSFCQVNEPTLVFI